MKHLLVQNVHTCDPSPQIVGIVAVGCVNLLSIYTFETLHHRRRVVTIFWAHNIWRKNIKRQKTWRFADPVVFSNFKTANTLFKTVWTIYYHGCTENASQHPVLGNITAPSTAVAFPYLTAYLQVFCLFIFFGKIIIFAFLLLLIGPRVYTVIFFGRSNLAWISISNKFRVQLWRPLHHGTSCLSPNVGP